MSRKVLALIIALIFGVFVSLLVYGQLNRYRSELNRVKSDLRPVVVVTHDLEAYTKLKAEDMKVVSIPKTSLPSGEMITIEQALGKSTLIPMTTGDMVTSGKLALDPDKLTMAFKLSPGTLAIAVPIDEVVAAGGYVHPGDMVDLIHVIRQSSNRPMVSRLLLSRIKLLALGTDQGLQEKGKTKAKKVLPPTALLQVTAKEATMVAWAQSQGSFWLALRPSRDEIPSRKIAYHGPADGQLQARTENGQPARRSSGASSSTTKKPWSIEMILPGQLSEIQVPIN